MANLSRLHSDTIAGEAPTTGFPIPARQARGTFDAAEKHGAVSLSRAETDPSASPGQLGQVLDPLILNNGAHPLRETHLNPMFVVALSSISG